ncbi:DUF4430 domain-containing protein [Halobacillus sp. B29]|uniref:DUF4430 domain-containing protein n=1 Tax=Halobacillus sp. B29 TaxID=3457432 RepID=UPI003FCD5F23
MNKLYALMLAVLLTAGILSGCGTQKEEQANAVQEEEKQEVSVQIEISKNNGEKTLADKELSVEEGAILMKVLEDNFEVEQSDGMINSIEGISANQDKKMAWMYTINGEEAQVGANDYELKQGDEIVFDYHSWE